MKNNKFKILGVPITNKLLAKIGAGLGTGLIAGVQYLYLTA